ncbi:adenosylcobinamide-GDP ribazoletransferase [Vibrio makurazakiensis]|uniref:adenosylcobinamide-GDP ribazoletransferase n=1 Tax=Vibrio makurazakiensis TaxID=2910250 RepID=UPI003D0E9268
MFSWFKYQLELFSLAVSFFSRLPIPASTPYSDERMNRAGRYFSLVGLVIGALCTGVYWLLSQVFSAEITIFLTMAFSLMLTGAFHEDGLTDMADGIGGGMTTERRLTIMKDSRIGTYGAATLTMALFGKWLLLTELSGITSMYYVLLVGYGLSRAVAASLIYDMPYVSDLDTSKSKPLANKQTTGELIFLMVVGLTPALMMGLNVLITLTLLALVFRITFKHWLLKRLGGFTGDCLGAAQQLMELAIYLVLIALFQHHFISTSAEIW